MWMRRDDVVPSSLHINECPNIILPLCIRQLFMNNRPATQNVVFFASVIKFHKRCLFVHVNERETKHVANGYSTHQNTTTFVVPEHDRLSKLFIWIFCVCVCLFKFGQTKRPEHAYALFTNINYIQAAAHEHLFCVWKCVVVQQTRWIPTDWNVQVYMALF